jgi:7-keto-8-aminopelargonate synthetase-like enzyme
MSLFTKCEKFTEAKEVQALGLYPYFHELQSQQDVEVIMEGKRRIMLGSNNYLGLTADERVKEAAIAATRKYGSGCSGSRFLNGTLNLHTQLERDLAEFLHAEAVITFSTGFQSNLGIISSLCGRGDYIISDKENHASIYDGCKLSYAKHLRFNHSDMADLERVLANIPEDAGKLIVTDGVFSMSGDICLLPEIVELKKKYKARLMVDDAHGLGVIGVGGRGTASYFGLEDEVDIILRRRHQIPGNHAHRTPAGGQAGPAGRLHEAGPQQPQYKDQGVPHSHHPHLHQGHDHHPDGEQEAVRGRGLCQPRPAAGHAAQ